MQTLRIRFKIRNYTLDILFGINWFVKDVLQSLIKANLNKNAIHAILL